jgi:hypothetical protein
VEVVAGAFCPRIGRKPIMGTSVPPSGVVAGWLAGMDPAPDDGAAVLAPELAP